jgi:acetyl-CoA carboxylase carboxyltransferase component
MKKDKDTILASLEKNVLPVQHEIAIADGTPVGPSHDEIVLHAEEDYRFARERIKKLIDTSDEAISTMHALASDAEHPRAFEVLAGMIKTAADINGQLLSLQKERKKIVQTEDKRGKEASSNTTNNAIFVGTTSELQKLLKGTTDDDSIDV